MDPYCGSGTTLIEAALMDRSSIGLDLNPLAVFISTVKVTPLENHELLKGANELKNQIEPLLKINKESDLFFNYKR